MSMLGSLLAFVGISAAYRPPASIAAPAATVTLNACPDPKSRREVHAFLVSEFIVALQERPNDFTLGRHTLTDKATGMEWWIANGAEHFSLYGVSGCGCQNVRSDFAEDGVRAWAAFETWRDGAGALLSPHSHEAQRLWRANHEARSRNTNT